MKTLLGLSLAFTVSLSASSQKFLKNILGSNTPQAEKTIATQANSVTPPTDIESSLEKNVQYPNTGKYSDIIRAHQESEAKNIKKSGYTTEMLRNREVIIVSIPAADLFQPMDDKLTAQGQKLLDKFTRYLTTPGMYRIMVVMNTDNTGSENYRKKLSNGRADAVYNYYIQKTLNSGDLYKYALLDEMPVTDNLTMAHRAKNRRLEIYIVPGQELINQAKKGILQNVQTF